MDWQEHNARVRRTRKRNRRLGTAAFITLVVLTAAFWTAVVVIAAHFIGKAW